jgi:hypothetical protein
MAVLSQNSSTALAALQGLSDDQQVAVVEEAAAANPALVPAGDEAKVKLWRYLLIGLFIIAAFSIAGAIILAVNNLDATAAWVLATAVVTGSLGLFSRSPIT